MKSSIGVSNFLVEISRLSHSIVFLCFFALITEEDIFFISPRCSLELCIQIGICSFSPLPLAFFLSSDIFKVSSDNHLAFLHFFFLGMVLVTTEPPSIVLQALCLSDLILWIYLSLPLYSCKGLNCGKFLKEMGIWYHLTCLLRS